MKRCEMFVVEYGIHSLDLYQILVRICIKGLSLCLYYIVVFVIVCVIGVDYVC